MEVRWRNYIWRGPRPVVGPDDVEKLEAAWGVSLPEDYRSIVHPCHGMAPEPNVFDIGEGANVFNNLLTLTSGKHESAYAISTTYELIKPYVPPGIYPFGTTPGGEYLCFDYREAPPGQPDVVLVTTEMEIHPVAHSFRELLKGLHEVRD